MALGPLPDVQNVARVKLSGLVQGRPWVNLFYWHYSGPPPSVVGLENICDGYISAWTTHIAPAAHPGTSLSAASAWDLASRSGAVGERTASVVGTRTGGPLLTSTCAVSSWKVSYRWRGGHARTYWPVGTTTDVQSGHLWTDPARTAFNSALTLFLSSINSITYAGASGYATLVRYIHTPAPGELPEYFDPPLDLRIEDVDVDKRIDTQRRRLGPDL